MSNNKSLYWNKNDRYIRLMDRLYEEESAELIDALIAIDKDEDRDPIDLYINCYGGYAHDLFAVYDVVQNLNSTVNTIGLGKCMSGGCFLLMSGTGERKAYYNTRIMIHGLQCGIPYRSLEENRSRWEEDKQLQKMIIDLIVKHTGQHKEKVEKDIKRDRFMSAEEAMEYGIIDEIIGGKNET